MINNPELIPVTIYEDDSMLAVVKPYGMIVNNADTSRHEFTLQDWVEKKSILHLESEDKDGASEFAKRAGIVHRLDKETSGILLIAKNADSFKELQRQFKEREVKKTYLALCHGEFKGEGGVSVPVGRLPWNRTRFGVVPDGRSAETNFKPKDIFEDPDDNKLKLSLVEAFPKTGRTHQIRVHLQYLNHPIYSDILYGGRKQAKRDRKNLSRHFLHAKKIEFVHPVSKKNMILDSELPNDLDAFLKTLNKL